MKKIIAILWMIGMMIPQMPAFALHDSTKSVNEKYAGYIADAIEKSGYDEQLDKDNIYIIEKSNTTIFKNNSELNEFYVAIPLLGTDDIAYSIFRKGKYYREVLNPASMLYLENHLNTKIDQYIEDNHLENVTEVVNTIFYGRKGIDSYRVVANNETYFIPYHIEFQYNLANDEKCALELGKAYKANDFIERLEREEISFSEYKEQQQKNEEERITAEAEKEAAKYQPTISLDENGDEIIIVNGYNLDDILNELTGSIDLMGFASNIEIGVTTEDKNYIAKYYWQKGCDTDAVSEFAQGLFDEIKTQVVTGKPNPMEHASYCNFNLKHDEGYKSIRHNVEISTWDDGVKITVNREDPIELKVKNPDAILDYIDGFGNNRFNGFKYEKNDENTPHYRDSLDGLTKTDIIEFKFELTDDVEGSLTKEVASPGETVYGVFEKYKENKYKSTYILTLSGSKGTIALYHQNQSSLSGEDEYFSNHIPLSFSDKLRFEDGQLVEYKVGKTQKYYEFKMIFSNNDISQVYFEDIKCTALKYTQLADDTTLSDEYAEKNKDVVIREAKECADTLYDLGLFKGTDKGYELEKSLTREESATILVRLLGEEEKVDADDFDEVFIDVDKDRWSYANVMYCYENNITKGTSSNTFSPDVQIDAEQFIALLMRLLGYTDVNPDTALDQSVEYKLLPANMVEKLEETDVFTRSEMVQIVYNSLKTSMANGTILAQYLADRNVITQSQADGVGGADIFLDSERSN